MLRSPGSRLGRVATAFLALVVGVLGFPLLTASPALADTAPTSPTPPTVSADALPTVQINGVVYSQVISGSTVYAVGEFTSARPAGSAAGTNETARSNILSYDLTTGQLNTGFTASLNGRGYSVAVSSDGTRVFVSGDFTQVNGISHPYVAALDATTGAPVDSWAASTNARTRALSVSGNVVYIGGIFTVADGQARTRIAALDATTGALLSFAPTADQEVMTILSPAGSGKVIAGGHLQYANGQETDGLAAFNASDGSLIPWTTTKPDGTTASTYGIFPNYGTDSAFYSMTTDGTRLIVTAYNYHGPSGFENSASIILSSGQVEWVNGCKGDTYSSAYMSGVVYVTGHAHDCGMLQGNPQVNPNAYQRTLAETVGPASDGRVNTYQSYLGWKAPELLHWLPTLDPGSYTGQTQAAWSVAADANSGYVVLGGEFPRVNGVAQAGLVRFKTNSLNKEGPQSLTDSKPVLTALGSHAVRVAWTLSWDRDNRNLKYEILRGTALASATVVRTLNYDSAWWNRPVVDFVDLAAPVNATSTYRIRATDPLNNVQVSPTTAVTTPTGDASSTYAGAVTADAPSDYWRLGEPSGTTAYDWSNTPSDLTLDSANTRNVPGALPEGNTATTFPGTATVPGGTTGSTVTAPTALTVEAWINTTSTVGGKIVGFGNSATAASSTTDRHLYMDTAGKLYFGVTSASTARTLVSPLAYNDGQWHHVVGTIGSGGESLYVDARQVGFRSDTTSAQGANGYWRVGGDSLSGWAGTHQNAFVGSVDEVAIYPFVLASSRVAAHYNASGRTASTTPRPTDAYGGAVYDAGPSSYWRLNEASGTVAADSSYNGTAPATYFNGVVQGRPGVAGTAAQFDGVDDVVSSASSVVNPTTYSEELWFSTTTTRGGKLIGFGSAQTGNSAKLDRHVIMLNTGQLTFGTYNGSRYVITSLAAYNDGKWHHTVATQGSDGMKLYVDGQLVGTNANTTPQNNTGYWRVGGDVTWGGTASNYIAATIDEPAVYPLVLTAAQVQDHFAKGGGGVADKPPTAAFTSTSTNLVASFDASTSTDSDGTIASYAWNFGDSSAAGTGVTPTHTFAAAGTYQVSLTVTDNQGAATTVTNAVTVVRVNQAPTASFTSSVSGSTASFDGTASADSDGTVASYAWNYGDGTTGTGVTSSHTYAATGTYSVVLTVTDSDGATGTVTNSVVITPPNVAPVSRFTSTVQYLAASFDGTTSTDSDGTVATYAWDYGDGTTGNGSTSTHTYATVGTFTVTLTVTDNSGATNASTAQVTTTATPQAADAFGRTVTNGWGSADVGGAWSLSGGNTSFAVANGTGNITVATSQSKAAYLNTLSLTNATTTLGIALDKTQTGSGTYVIVAGRHTSGGDYNVKVRTLSNGTVTLQLSKTVSGTETLFGTAVTLPGVTFAAGDQLMITISVTGTGTTNLAAKAWKVGQTEPTAWTATTTDSTAALQVAGSVGFTAYVSGSFTGGPENVSVDNVVVR